MNRILIQIDPADFPPIYSLLQKSFAPIEIRTYEKQLALFDNPHYKILVSLDDNKAIQGFIVEWNFEKFNFLEHFAIQPELRGGGIGSEMMRSYLQNSNKPVIIEVEADESELSQRRINFYRRLGFHLNEFGYFQPSMQNISSAKIPLKIMSYPFEISFLDLERFKEELFNKVYNV